MTGVTILLVDDHPIVREGYRRLLERQPGFSVCAEVDNAQSRLSRLQGIPSRTSS